jgi:methyl-accepting chemotaxis protein
MSNTDTIDPRLLLKSLRDFKKGDFSVRMPTDQIGIAGEICEAFNDSLEYANRFVNELDRISTVVGKEGKTDQRATLPTVHG